MRSSDYGTSRGSTSNSNPNLASVPPHERVGLLEDKGLLEAAGSSAPHHSTSQGFPKFSSLKESIEAAVLRPSEEPTATQPPEFDRTTLVACASLLGLTNAALSCSLIPLFESLRSSVGFSSFQVSCLNSAAPFFAAVFSAPVASALDFSRVWDVLAWSALASTIGGWVSSCASWGSPLEYMMLGQLLVGLSISMLWSVPGKISAFWLPGDTLWGSNMVWTSCGLIGMSLPFLFAPLMAGGEGHGSHLGRFLLWRAVIATGVAALVLALRSGMSRDEGTEREEGLLYRHRAGAKGFSKAAVDIMGNGPLISLLLAVSMTLGVAYSFYMLAPLLLSFPPHNYSPYQSGQVLWAMGPAGVLGILIARSPAFFGLDRSKRFKPAMLVAIGGSAAWLIIFIMVLERTNAMGLGLTAASVMLFAAPLAYVAQQVVVDMAFPLHDVVSASVAYAIASALVAVVPVATVCLTHPFVAEYPNENESPTGFILSWASIFWLLLLSCSFLGVLFGYKDDERRIVVDANPQLIQHVTERVAADVAQARAFSELAIPLPSRWQGGGQGA